VQVRLGQLEHKRNQNVDKAIEHFERALGLADGHAEALASLEEIARASGDHRRLAGLLARQEAKATDPAKKAALTKEIVKLHLGPLGDPAGALGPLERVLAATPNDKEALLQLVDAYDRLGRHQDSVPVLQRLVAAAGTSRSKDMAAVHHRLGRALEGMGDMAGALTELEKAQKIDLTNVPLLRDLGKLAHRTGDLDKAQKTFRALLLQKLDETSGMTKADVYWYLGDILEKQGDPKKALGMYERGVEADRNHVQNKEAVSRLRG
jgi:tetratricopeptide (TPR) repeat protein